MLTPTDLSRLRSTFSSSPLRTDTDRPAPSDTSTLASVAPMSRARTRQSSTICWNCSRGYEKPCSTRGRDILLLGTGGDKVGTMIPSDPLPSRFSIHSPAPAMSRAPTLQPAIVDARWRRRAQQDAAQAAVARAAETGHGTGRAVRRAAAAPGPARAAVRRPDAVPRHAHPRRPSPPAAVRGQADARSRRRAAARGRGRIQAGLGARHAAAAPGRSAGATRCWPTTRR